MASQSPQNIFKHDALCDELGHDALCPPTDKAVVPHQSDGKWPKGVGGNRYGPRRLKAARALIAELTDGGRLIIERLCILGGVIPDPKQMYHSDGVQVRALKELREIYYGKQIRNQVAVKVGGTVSHDHVHRLPTEAEQARLSRMSDEDLAKLDAAYQAIEDAEFTEAMQHASSEPGPAPAEPEPEAESDE